MTAVATQLNAAALEDGCTREDEDMYPERTWRMRKGMSL